MKIERETHKIDATEKIAGRLASQIAVWLQGKNRPDYQPHIDCGGLVEVSHVAKMKFSGRKVEQKVYHRYTGYPGGIRTTKLKNLLASNPAEVLRRTVFNMLPKNKLRPKMLKRLTIN
jgi:large subunit ribosomal protein L13